MDAVWCIGFAVIGIGDVYLALMVLFCWLTGNSEAWSWGAEIGAWNREPSQTENSAAVRTRCTPANVLWWRSSDQDGDGRSYQLYVFASTSSKYSANFCSIASFVWLWPGVYGVYADRFKQWSQCVSWHRLRPSQPDSIASVSNINDFNAVKMLDCLIRKRTVACINELG